MGFVMSALQSRFNFRNAMAVLAATSALVSPVAAQQQRTPFEDALLDVEPDLINAVAPKPKDPKADPAAAALRAEANTGVRAFLRNVNDVYNEKASGPKPAKAGLANPNMLFAIGVVPAFKRVNDGLDRAAYCFSHKDKVVTMGTIGLDGKLGPALIDGKPWTGPTTPTVNAAGKPVDACMPFINAYGRWLNTLGKDAVAAAPTDGTAVALSMMRAAVPAPSN